MLKVFQLLANLAVAIFRVNEFRESFGRCFVDLALGSVSDMKP
jgi:hypothetical protein